MIFTRTITQPAPRPSEVQTIAHWKMSILWLQNKLTLCWEILPIPQLLCPQNCIWKRSLFSWPIWTSWLNKRKNRIALNYNACFFGIKMRIQNQSVVMWQIRDSLPPLYTFMRNHIGVSQKKNRYLLRKYLRNLSCHARNLANICTNNVTMICSARKTVNIYNILNGVLEKS